MTEVLQSLCVLELVGRNIDESRVQQVRVLDVPRRAALERVRQNGENRSQARTTAHTLG